MLVEQIIRESKGFASNPSKRWIPNWLSFLFLIFATIPAAGYVIVPVITGTRSLKDDFAMCPCGRYQ